MKLIVTPDFGRSDAWDFSFATKFLLGNALHEGRIPVWTRLLGGGFPLIGEGQIGAFFLPNLILFRLLPVALAYNLTLIVAVGMAGGGMYIFLRRLRLAWLTALFGGISFALSGIIVPQLTHHTLIQGISLLPWILVATDMLCEKRTAKRIALWAFLVSQQILVGFPQAVFITVLLALCYAAWQKKVWRLIVPGALALGLGAIQLLPSYEFLTQSTVQEGFSPTDATYFSFPLIHLKTLLWPYLLGNPTVGTYPHFALFDGSIFWENTGFFGTIGLLLGLAGILLALRKPTPLRFFIASAATGFLLMLGKYSPLYVIFSFWPFHFFRVPSRFLWIFVFSLIVLASYALNTVLAKKSRVWKTFAIALVLINSIQLGLAWKGYHAMGDADAWTNEPEIVSTIRPSGRIYTIGADVPHNEVFLAKGWQDPTQFYALRGALAPDSNAIWGVASADVYAGRQLRRQGIVLTLLSSEIELTPQMATVSAAGMNLLQLVGVEHVLAAIPIQMPHIQPATASTGGISIYQLPAAPRVYMATDVRWAETLREATGILKDPNFVAAKSVLLEGQTEDPVSAGVGTATIIEEQDARLTIKTKSEQPGILVVADTYYPGWVATIDGVEASILPANIAQRAVAVPAGEHTVIFSLRPQSLIRGAAISLITLFLTVSLVVYRSAVAAVHRSQTIPRRVRHPRRNPYTSRTHIG